MSRRPSLLPIPAAVIVVATAITACGSSSSSSSRSSSSSGSSGSSGRGGRGLTVQAAVKFSDCMRAHGVSFPDPATDPHAFKFAFAPDSTPSQSPAFHSAFQTCRHLLPDNGASSQSAGPSQAQIAAFLAFARCMRAHGFPSFPDPSARGELSRQMLANAGIDIHQPGAAQAADACTVVTHGVITRAGVARFIAGQ